MKLLFTLNTKVDIQLPSEPALIFPPPPERADKPHCGTLFLDVKRAHVGQQIINLLRIANAEETHLVARHNLARRLDEGAQFFFSPDEAGIFHRR